MNNEADFDALSKSAFTTNAGGDLDKLFGAVFALPEWLFIARGEMPNVNPYIAANAAVTDGQQMVRAFTDSRRLQRFAKENNLTEVNGSCYILSVPTSGIIEYLEQFTAYGVHGVWFNSDTESEGFFIPLKQLRPIKEHLAKSKIGQKPSFVILHFAVKEGLMLPSADILPAPYKSNLFWRVPSDWVENGEVKTDHLWKIERRMSGGLSETIEGAFYVVTDYSTKVLDSEAVKTADWKSKTEDDDNVFMFFVVSETGEIKKVTAEEFQADVNASL